MRLEKVACPECGAGVVVGSKNTVRCEYCGTVSQVQRRTRFLERPVPIPHAQGPVVTTPHSTGWKASVLIVPLLLAGLIVISAVAARHAGGHAYVWNSFGGVVLADVDHDGVLDPIGRASAIYGDGSGRLVAIDGRTGKTLWLSEVFSKEQPNTGRLSVAGSATLLIKEDAEFIGYDVATGKQRFAGSLPEKLKQLCEAKEGLTVITADDKRLHLDARNGALTPSSDAAECWEVHRDGPHSPGPGHQVLAWNELPQKIEGMTISWGFRRRDGATVVLGHREKGTSVPMVAARVGGSSSFWVRDVPAHDPLKAETREPHVVTTAGNRVLVTYTPDTKCGGGWGFCSRLTAFALADGNRLWDAEVPLERGHAEGISAAGDRAYVSSSLLLHIFALADGRHLMTVDLHHGQ